MFVLRIEDTDVERSSAEMVTGILDGLRWLGLDWDEGPEKSGPYGPYFQSERLDRYRAVAGALVQDGRAYYCYCSPERLRAEREGAEHRGEAWKYDRACLQLAPERIAELEAIRAPRAVRFRVPAGEIAFNDGVHGRIAFDHAQLEDFVILRSDEHPTYHLSVVVDDVDMRITHVVRGDDHISNTPKHVLLFKALGVEVPHFAHVPLILGTDRKRLSKRHGATSVMEYKRAGYLPDALVNFLALLGWAPGDDRELMTREELIAAFTLEGISGGNAVFNTEKLDWMNGQYIAALPLERLAEMVVPLLREAELWPAAQGGGGEEYLRQVVELVRPRAKRLVDFVEQVRPFFADRVEYDPDAVRTHLAAPDLATHLEALVRVLRTTMPFDESHVEAAVRGTAAERGIKAGELIHAARVAATGRAVSPGLFEVLVLLGRHRTVERLAQLRTFLSAHA